MISCLCATYPYIAKSGLQSHLCNLHRIRFAFEMRNVSHICYRLLGASSILMNDSTIDFHSVQPAGNSFDTCCQWIHTNLNSIRPSRLYILPLDPPCNIAQPFSILGMLICDSNVNTLISSRYSFIKGQSQPLHMGTAGSLRYQILSF